MKTDIPKLTELIDQGLTRSEIISQLGISNSTLTSVFKKYSHLKTRYLAKQKTQPRKSTLADLIQPDKNNPLCPNDNKPMTSDGFYWFCYSCRTKIRKNEALPPKEIKARQPTVFTDEVINKAVELLSQGMTLTDVAKAMGKKRGSLYSALKRNNKYMK